MLSPLIKYSLDPADDLFHPDNVPRNLCQAVARAQVELGPMPSTRELAAIDSGAEVEGEERLWWTPVTGTLYSTRSGGTVIADIHGRNSVSASATEREWAIRDLCEGLSGLKRWNGRGVVCVARHTLAMIAATARLTRKPKGYPVDAADRFSLLAFVGGHDLGEATGEGDISSPIGGLADGLFREARQRAVSATYNLVRPWSTPPEFAFMLVDWCRQLDKECAAIENAYTFGRTAPWIARDPRLRALAEYALVLRPAGRKPETPSASLGMSANAAELLAHVLIGATDDDENQDSILRMVEDWSDRDQFGSVCARVWDHAGGAPPIPV